MYEHALAALNACLPQKMQRTRRAHEYGRRVLEGHVGRLVRKQTVLSDTSELGVRAELVAPRPEDPIAGSESGHTRPDRGHRAGEIHAEHLGLRLANPVHEPHEQRAGAHDPVAVAHRRGMHTHEHLVVTRDRSRHVPDLDNVRGTVAGDDGGLHAKAIRTSSRAGSAASLGLSHVQRAPMPRVGTRSAGKFAGRRHRIATWK